ncbi:Predicted DNA-binding transcriptional regulator YafY, contains an HTH and WYL domains [Amycolatopsis arida]|uniref:Predicted DNA-binding transcriptional regulator YafY, contains an HTH and WYL domains n=1 Tax=Amycolatopsis arida TaxID=587909 RepID=A0A1I5Z0G0_9PSEU|nr:YafY family protein [Amycolatopsis arida]TDX90020.1 putative DNA-binding transcriptional regulator YafY [Amycolatopsis arida]SFQ49919.1 Predicted DNA-binding transcriptional regulator YafY, contains an HTH and WYL domains [Amycolatopsis arida]
MANTSTRTLRLLSLLQTHRYWPGTELAERLGVSARTLRRDIDRLRELGYPVEARRGVDGGYQLAPGAALPPLMVDDEEAVALVVGLQTATQTAGPGIADASVRALAKVVQVMPARLRRRVEAIRVMTVPAGWGGPAAPGADPGVLTAVTLACRDSERLRFSYTAAKGERTSRHVEPHRLVSLSRRWYLVAYDLTRHDWRSFRLDRITEPHRTGARFGPRPLPAADAAEFVRAGLDNLPRPFRVAALVDAPAASVRERIGRWAGVEDVDGERCRVLMTVESLEWAIIALGVIEADFHVLDPPELLDRVRDWGVRFARARPLDGIRPPRRD